MASVRKRKWTHNGVDKEAWVIAYVDRAGKRRQETFEKKKDADRRRQKIEEELNGGVHVAMADGIDVAKACELYLEDCERRMRIGDRITKATLAQYRKCTRHVIARFGTVKLQNLEPIEIEKWLSDMCLTHKRASVVAYAYALRQTLTLAVKHKYTAKNPMRDGTVKFPDIQEERIKIPTREEIGLLLSSLATRTLGERHMNFHMRRVIITLGVFCGLRSGEISGLNWSDIDFEAARLDVKRSNSQYDGLKSPKTKAGYRSVHMPKPVITALRDLEHFRIKPDQDGPVCASFRNKRIAGNEIWNTYKVVAERCGLLKADGSPKYRFHALRHAAVSLLIAQGVPAMHIKGMIGHKNVSTTLNVYGHLYPEDDSVKRGMDEVAGRFSVQQQSNKALQITDFTDV